MDSDLLSAVGSVASVVVAIFAAVVAYFAWITAQNSAKATAALTEIERARWHAESRPEFEVEIDGVVNDNRLAACTINLIGSRSLVWVDVVAHIRAQPFVDENPEPSFGPYVWENTGPFFGTPTESKPFRMEVGSEETLWLEAASSDKYARYNYPVRLWLDCTAENGDIWRIAASARLHPVQESRGSIVRPEHYED